MYTINVKVVVASSNSVNMSFGCGLSTSSTTTITPNFLNDNAFILCTNAISMQSNTQHTQSFSCMYSSSGEMIYILKYLKWYTSNSGYIVASVQATKIA